MAEEVEKVTTEKQKNPGRQEWGRKLGKMQKQLKVAKQNEEIPENKSESNNSIKWEYVLAGVTLLLGLGALYYQKKSYECQLKMQKQQKPVNENKTARFSDF